MKIKGKIDASAGILMIGCNLHCFYKEREYSQVIRRSKTICRVCKRK